MAHPVILGRLPVHKALQVTTRAKQRSITAAEGLSWSAL